MTERAARPSAMISGRRGPALLAALCLLVALDLAGPGCAIARASGQPSPPPPPPPTPRVTVHRIPRHLGVHTRHVPPESALAAAESIYADAERRLRLLAGKSDSLAAAESLYARTQRKLEFMPGLPDSTRERILEETIAGLNVAIKDITRELENLDLRIEDQAISLRDRQSGGRIRINIPPDLGEQISKGISSITASILSELPDTSRIQRHGHLGRPAIPQRPPVVQPPAVEPPAVEPPAAPVVPVPPPRRVIGGDVVRVFGNILVNEDEQVQGTAVAVLGDVVVRGEVKQDVVAVLGNVDLADGSAVGGEVLAILGRLDRDPGAEVAGTVFSLAPGLFGRMGNVRALFWAGWAALLARVALFVVSAVLLVLLLTLAPTARLQSVEEALAARPGASFGYGLLWLVVGHLLLVPLMAVLALSLIGIPLALLLALAYVALTLLAVGVAAARIGARVRGGGSGGGGAASRALLGFVLLSAFGLLGALLGVVPGLAVAAIFLGILDVALKLAALAWGLGGLLLSRLGRRPAPVPAAPQPAGVS